MILICYDGSEDARAAIAQAATLMPGHPAVALTVWSPASENGGEDEHAWAERTAAEGAESAHAAGVDCVPRAVCHPGGVPEAVLEEARRSEARAIVVGRGSRGEPGEEGLGPVATALLREATCAVLVAGAAIDEGVLDGRRARTGALA
jgi:nucleotide-binding universal stress UspA family protein